MYCFCEDLIFLDKINVKKVSPLFRRFLCHDTFFSTNPLYMLHPYKQTTEYTSKRVSQQGREASFSYQWNAEKIHSCPSISNILAYLITIHCSLHHYKSHYYMSPQVGLGMCKNLAVRFSAWKHILYFLLDPSKRQRNKASSVSTYIKDLWPGCWHWHFKNIPCL